MTPQLRTVTVNNVQLAYFERGTPRAQQPTLYFVHATGFHGRVWDYLAEQFPQHHIIALEQRGHGRSEKKSVRNWRTFGLDQAAFVRALGLQQLIGIGHSMGAHGLIDAAAATGAFSSLLLLDPTVAAPGDYAPGNEDLPDDMELHPAAKRRRYFSSAAEMRMQIQSKSAFPLFVPRILDDYCEYGLVPAEGGFELACPPEVEAWVYMSSRSNGGVYDSVSLVDVPVTVMRARAPAADNPMDFSASPTWPGLAAAFDRGREIYMPDCTHFIPMQAPDRVVAEVRRLIGDWGP